MSNANVITTTLGKVKEMLTRSFASLRPPILISSPGLGKSSLFKQIAKERELKFIDVRLTYMDPTDLNGFPTITEVDGVKMASYTPFDTFPLKNAEDPQGKNMPINPDTGRPYKGFLVLLDELMSAAPALQVAAYRILLDREVGNHELHPKVFIGAAGNLATDKAVVQRISTATQSRLVWYVIEPSFHEWLEDFAIPHGIDQRIIDFLSWKPDMLHKFDPNHNDLTFACPRTWHMLSDHVKNQQLSLKFLPMYAGNVGAGTAREWFAFCEVYDKLPSFTQIINDPMGVKFDQEPSVEYALIGVVASKMNVENVKECIQFLSRLAPDAQTICLRQAVARDRTILKEKAVNEWARRIGGSFLRGMKDAA